MEGFTEAEPEGLWDAVQAGMPAPKRRVAAIWWITGAAALLAAAAIAAIVLFRPSEKAPDAPMSAPVIIADSSDDELIVSAPEELVPQTVPSSPRTVPTQAEPIVEETPEQVVEVSTEPVIEEISVIEETPVIEDTPEQVPDETPGSNVDVTPEPAVEDKVEDVVPVQEEIIKPVNKPVVRPLPKLRPRVQVLLAYTSPGQSASISTTGIGLPTNPGYSMATKATGSYSDLSMLSRNKTSTTDASHRQSARLAVGLQVNLDERWGIQTGLVSSTLESEFESTAGSLKSTTFRKMQYLGIPIYGCYNVFEEGKLGMSVNAGPMYEFSTQTSSFTRTYAGTRQTGGESDDTLCDDSKWSMNAGAAFQYRIRKHGALYVQPGVSYYFKDKSTLETVYTEHPARFNLTFGYKYEF